MPDAPPSEKEISELVKNLKLRLEEPLAGIISNLHIKKGFEAVIYVLENEISEIKDFNFNVLSTTQQRAMVMRAMDYLKGEAPHEHLLYIPFNPQPETDTKKVLNAIKVKRPANLKHKDKVKQHLDKSGLSNTNFKL